MKNYFYLRPGIDNRKRIGSGGPKIEGREVAEMYGIGRHKFASLLANSAGASPKPVLISGAKRFYEPRHICEYLESLGYKRVVHREREVTA